MDYRLFLHCQTEIRHQELINSCVLISVTIRGAGRGHIPPKKVL